MLVSGYVNTLSLNLNKNCTGSETRIQEYFNPCTQMISLHVILAVNDNELSASISN